MTYPEDEKKPRDGSRREEEPQRSFKAPKPPRTSTEDREEGWVSSPPVDWTTRPIGEGDAATAESGDGKEEPKRSLLHPARILRDVVIPLAIAFSIALLAQATLAKPYQIPSGSMEPTIQVNDRILANRFIYHFKSIERGDIIVFEPPQVEGVDTDTPYVKRVIGLPGDEIEVREGITYVNGEEFVVDQVREPPLYKRKLETVPDGMLFVLGDNRNSSLDSHVWGFLPMENVIGRAEVIYWPLGNLERLD